MKADLGIWVYVLAGILISAVILLKAEELMASPWGGKGDPWPLYHFLERTCPGPAEGDVVMRGPFEVGVVNGTFCYRGECRELPCEANISLALPPGLYTYHVEVEDGEVVVWPRSQT